MTDAKQRAEETVTDQAIALQGEMDLTMLELLIEVDRKTNRVAEDFLALLHVFYEDTVQAILEELSGADATAIIIQGQVERILSLKGRIEARKNEIRNAPDDLTRALLEGQQLSDILDKNLLILQTILALREALAELDRIARKMAI